MLRRMLSDRTGLIVAALPRFAGRFAGIDLYE
jgi:hypothetical protein